jgi:hypothetical protein
MKKTSLFIFIVLLFSLKNSFCLFDIITLFFNRPAKEVYPNIKEYKSNDNLFQKFKVFSEKFKNFIEKCLQKEKESLKIK